MTPFWRSSWTVFCKSRIVIHDSVTAYPLLLPAIVSNRRKMGRLVVPRSVAAVSWIVASIIVALNAKLLFDAVIGTG